MGDDIPRYLDYTCLIYACDCGLEHNLWDSDSLNIEMYLVTLLLTFEVERPWAPKKSVHETFGPVGLCFSRIVLREARIVLQQLRFYPFQRLAKVLFFFIVALFAGRNSSINSPVVIVGAEIVIVATSSSLPARLIGRKICQCLHSVLACKGFAVAKIRFQLLFVFELL